MQGLARVHLGQKRSGGVCHVGEWAQHSASAAQTLTIRWQKIGQKKILLRMDCS
jgi:hypothetical protein